MLAFMGFAMIAVIVYLLVESKSTPAPVFTIVPIVAALIVGVPFTELIKFIKAGVGTTMPIAALFMFSIIYFSVMTDVGMFEPMVNYLVKKAGNNVVIITVATGLIATVGHLDGALASTLLVTIPAMLPIYKKMNMRPVVLLLIIGAAMSIMNLVPWGGPVARTAAITKIDINVLWKMLIPVQIVGFGILMGICVFLGIVEKKRGAGMSAEALAASQTAAATEEVDPKVAALRRPKLLWFNIALTACVIGLMCFTKIELYAAFMMGLAVALVVNFPNPKDQTARMKAHAPEALQMATILISSGIFLGVLNGAKMMGAMAQAMMHIIPTFVGPYLHIVMGVLSVPIGILLGTDSFFFGVVPIAISLGENFGIKPIDMANAMLIGKNYGVLVTPHAATTYLAIGLAGVELKELLYYCTPRLWIIACISLATAIILGVIPL